MDCPSHSIGDLWGGGGGGKWALGPNFGGKLTNFTILAPFDPGLLIKSGI